MTLREFYLEWSKAHGGANVTGIVRVWLSISFWITRPLSLLRISPNLLSVASVFAGSAFIWKIESNWSLFFLVLSLALDGIDGTLALTTGKSSKFGALVDAVADRIVESLWAYGFYLLGAPWPLVVCAWLAAFLQEYLRARAGGLGINEVVMVTVAERPVRASLIFIAIVSNLVGLELVVEVSALWAMLQTISALMLLRALRSLL
jgi:phosphatidylglycerophosphate synthase